jgi:peptidoglycan hydrolase CwlO-like protein
MSCLLQRVSKELKDVSSTSGADIQAARAEISRLTARATSLEQEVASAKQDAEQSSRLIEALKKQVEELRKEMKDIAREAAAKLEVSGWSAMDCPFRVALSVIAGLCSER